MPLKINVHFVLIAGNPGAGKSKLLSPATGNILAATPQDFRPSCLNTTVRQIGILIRETPYSGDPETDLVVHASLGAMEWPGAMEKAQEDAIHFGLPFIVAKANKTLLSMVENRFVNRPEVPSWPSSSTRQCTSDLKRGPIQREVRRFAKENGFKVVVNCLGIRAQESPGRAKRAAWSKMGISNSVLTWYEWLPIHDFKVEQVFQTIKDGGLTPHYAYALGNERLSCVFCIMASKNDLRNGAKHRPELLAEYHALEQKTGYTMHMSRIPLVELSA